MPSLTHTRPGLVIGRSPDCDIVVRDATVSRHHAVLRRDGDGWLLEDLGSKNGTGVNGEPLHGPAPVKTGDFVSLGRTGLRFSDADARHLV